MRTVLAALICLTACRPPAPPSPSKPKDQVKKPLTALVAADDSSEPEEACEPLSIGPARPGSAVQRLVLTDPAACLLAPAALSAVLAELGSAELLVGVASPELLIVAEGGGGRAELDALSPAAAPRLRWTSTAGWLPAD